jgi:hypothetical protein
MEQHHLVAANPDRVGVAEHEEALNGRGVMLGREPSQLLTRSPFPGGAVPGANDGRVADPHRPCGRANDVGGRSTWPRHQANTTMVVTRAQAAGIYPDQLYFNIEQMENGSSAYHPVDPPA